ncbi:MAG: tRNA glutamyl-Q(34) synthetase GluQRS [Pseudomonas sp.]
MSLPLQHYIGRFAPTPSGHLHFGSLLAALASCLDARHHNGTWLVRMEDLDLPRNRPGAAEHILSTLEVYGLHWDGEVLVQSQRQAFYQQQIDIWLEQQRAFYCDCSRKSLAEHDGIYPGTCRARHLTPAADHAVRVRVPDRSSGFVDRLQGPFSQKLQQDVGDMIVRRRDGIIAYQLAVVMDDITQGVTDIVRGADLLDSTPRQLWLYELLEQQQPAYMHTPLVVRREGEKLSKRLASAPLDPLKVSATLLEALELLQQNPPTALRGAPADEILAWAVPNWDASKIPACREIRRDTADAEET